MQKNEVGQKLKNIGNKILENYSIVDVIKNYITITKKGKDYKALCPFHGDKDPSLSISPTLNIFNCFSCQTKGNAITFVMKFKGLNYSDAIKEIIKILDINDKEIINSLNYTTNFSDQNEELYSINEKAMFIYHRTLFNSENKKYLDYLKEKRKMSEELIDFFDIGFAPKNKNNDYLQKTIQEIEGESFRPALLLKTGLTFLNNSNEYSDFFYDRIIIPIKNAFGKVVGFSGRTTNNEEKIKYLNTKATEIFKKENILFNFCNFDKTKYKELFIVEGYMDVFAYKKIGIENVVASMGTSFTDDQIKLIKNYPNINSIILSFDNDNAGIQATIKLYKKLSKFKFNIFVINPFDNKYKDVDELVNNLDVEEAKTILKNQVSFVQYLINGLKQKNLSYKDKKVETQKIIDWINEFAYNPLFINDDIDLLSDFSGIDKHDLKKMIIRKQENHIHSFSYQNKSYKNINNQQINRNKKLENIVEIKCKNKEKDLIPLLIFNKNLLEHFNKFLGFVQFNNEGYLNKILKIILFNCNNLNESHESTAKNIINKICIDPSLENEEKLYFKHFIKKFIDTNKETIIDEKKSLIKGLNIIKDLVTEIYTIRIKQETQLNQENTREKLKKERTKKLNEINSIFDGITKK